LLGRDWQRIVNRMEKEQSARVESLQELEKLMDFKAMEESRARIKRGTQTEMDIRHAKVEGIA